MVKSLECSTPVADPVHVVHLNFNEEQEAWLFQSEHSLKALISF